MGVKLFGSSSSYDSKTKVIVETVYRDVNPNPMNYLIYEDRKIGRYLILRIKYLDCVNYEGMKVLVYRDCSLEDLIAQKTIDPHFSENRKFHSPIARFTPTDQGMRDAVCFCEHSG